MPTYEYRCDACGHEFELFQSITADPVKRCPSCSKAKVRRLIGTGAGLIFKGSGFYITDYRDKSYAEKAKAESGGSGGGGDKPAETKTETKAAEPAKPAETTATAKPAQSKPAPKAKKK